MHGNRVVFEVDGDVRVVEVVVDEVALDLLGFIATEEDKVVTALRCGALHNVPEDRVVTNFHHWFWTEDGFLTEACTQSAR